MTAVCIFSAKLDYFCLYTKWSSINKEQADHMKIPHTLQTTYKAPYAVVGREGSAWANITVIVLHIPCIQMRLIYNKQPVRPILDGGNLLLFLSRLFRQYLKMGYWDLLLEISNKLLDTCSSSQSGNIKERRKKFSEAGTKNFIPMLSLAKRKSARTSTLDIQEEFICRRKKSNHPNCFCG